MIYGLTEKQRELLDYINSYSQDRGYAPTYQEMADHLGLRSKSGVHRLVHGLRERGHIRMPPARRARSIVGSNAATFTLYVPVELEARIRLVAETSGLSPEQIITNALRDLVAPKAA